MDKRILIVTNGGDLHADIVAEKLVARGGDPFRLNLDEFPGHFAVMLEFTGGRWEGILSHNPTGDTLSLSEIGAVWMRKKADFSFTRERLAPQERAFAESETEHILFSLLYSLDCYWMSHPVAVRGSIWKGEQLLRAARMGFDVPPAVITNRRACVDALNGTAGHGIVFKALSSPSLGASEVPPEERMTAGVPTTLIAEEHEEFLDAVVELPSFFQHYIPKQHELRVTVIGERLFAARIHSQDDPRTATDFRDFSAEILYETAVLPSEIERRCIEFVHSYGLTYGALDLIVTPDGDYVFLENNPVGQFLFVEQLVPELDMTGALAECLIEGAAKERVGRWR
jgi:glutathione synthase/RimK-type ligase-like ATP-grasp enzyme